MEIPELTERINNAFHLALDRRKGSLTAELTTDTLLLQTGLDSLGFAILVTILEEDLGYDPFVMMEDPVYPTTFGEFIAIYSQYMPGNA